MATSALVGSAAGDSNGQTTKITSPTQQQQSKASLGSKMGDSSKKPAEETTQSRSTEQKAWAPGSAHPFSQRSANLSQVNGTTTSGKPSQRSTTTSDGNSVLQAMTDRQIQVFGALFGTNVAITLKNDEKFTGIFAGVSSDDRTLRLLMVRASPDGSDGKADDVDEYCGTGRDHALHFSWSDVAGLVAENVSSQVVAPSNGANAGFRTDADISGNLGMRERNLQKWTAPTAATPVDMSLETAEPWDQFKANERFGVQSDYNEELYTTKIDTSNPLYAMRAREAERLAREIENDSNLTNAHMREERGIEDGNDVDEESKYSGVLRKAQDYPPLKSNQANKYTPPARRGLGLSSTTSTAGEASSSAVDPAIISSQIARAGSKIPDAEDAHAPPGSPPKAAAPAGTATDHVQNDVLDSFRAFASREKMKVQDSRRSRASADKAVKINDLMKFAKNFKLSTPVPKDLIPILAKDESKQKEIVEKANRLVESTSTSRVMVDTKTQKLFTSAKWNGESATPGAGPAADAATRGHARPEALPSIPQAPKDRQQSLRDLPSGRGAPNGLSQRLAEGHRQHKAGLPSANGAHGQDPRLPPIRPMAYGNGIASPQRSAGLRSPTSSVSGKLNVKAMEFKPNPAASAFRPASTKPTSVTSTPAIPSPTVRQTFLGDRTLVPLSERTSSIATYNTIRYLKTALKDDPKAQANGNGGIKRAYITPPIWTIVKDSEYKSYADEPSRAVPRKSPTPQQLPMASPAAHQHQLPFHLQNGSHGIPQVNAPQVPPPPHSQPGFPPHQPHFDDHHMRHSASSTSTYPAPSPRMQNTAMAYPSPMGHHAQLAYQQPMPHYVMNPGQQHATPRQFSAGPNMMGGQGPHLAAPMMVPQQSGGGGYMVNQSLNMPFSPQQMAMYPGGSPQGYGMSSQPPSGYPSPGRGAPMMMQQGSHQGQHQPMYLPAGQYGPPVYAQQPPGHLGPMRGNFHSPQPHYAQAPYQQQQQQQQQQQHHYPHQPHRTPSAGYAQLSPPHHQQQHMPGQQVTPPVSAMEVGDQTK